MPHGSTRERSREIHYAHQPETQRRDWRADESLRAVPTAGSRETLGTIPSVAVSHTRGYSRWGTERGRNRPRDNKASTERHVGHCTSDHTVRMVARACNRPVERTRRAPNADDDATRVCDRPQKWVESSESSCCTHPPLSHPKQCVLQTPELARSADIDVGKRGLYRYLHRLGPG